MNKDTNIIEIKPIVTPNDLLNMYYPSKEDIDFIVDSRKDITNILNGTNNRMLVIVGPCSIHDYDSAIDYAKQLLQLKNSNKNLYLVMRVYFEKPRSRTGWKGYIYDPYVDNTNNINKGLELARKLLLEIVRLRLPVGCEFLDLITPQYISDLVSWGAIGARTSESQTHRQLTSGLSMPVGFKNLTSGDCEKAVNGIISAMGSHNFMSIDNFGKVSQVTTRGNNSSHLILRGGDEPNYQEKYVEEVTNMLKKENINTGIIIDCSHGNSQSDYNRQLLAALYIKRLRLLNKYPIRGIMLESHINKGKQTISTNMKYGVSVTDSCIDIETTRSLLALLNETNLVSGNTLGENRKIIRDYDKIIYGILNSQEEEVNLKNTTVLTNHIFERDKEIADFCRGRYREEDLMLMVSMRFAISERIADIKFASNPFDYLNISKDFMKLVTDREIELDNLKLFNDPVYLRIMDLSKGIQVEYLEKYTSEVKIGYLYGRGTFSHEALTQNFRGQHKSYESVNELRLALENKEIDFMLLPTYNSLIGGIFPMESYWTKHGSVDHKINLNLYSNKNLKAKDAHILYLEAHVQMEAEQYIKKNFRNNITIVQVRTSKDGCVECIKQVNCVAMTISSAQNNSNFLFPIDTDIVEHNVTTFTLISL
jgi:3-deoxy-7-phosphoheptulonate synthase